jgi:aminopeptidase N
MMGRMGAAFWRPGQSELLEPFAQAYLDALPAMGSSGMTWAMSLTGNMFPKVGADEQLADRLEHAAAGPEVTVLVAKRVLERLDRLRRMLVGRRAVAA